jgi:hypothetical protein
VADLYIAEQTVPSTPASGNLSVFADSTASAPAARSDSGRAGLLWVRANTAVAAQGAGFSSDTYVTNSDILIPSFGMQAGHVFRWTISASKTAAGTATPVYSIRIGANRTTGDTARLQITGPAQTAAADVGLLTLMVTVRSVSATGVLQGTTAWAHNGAAVGFCNNDAGAVEATSAAFDNSALGGSYVGLSIDGGASAAWTLTQIVAEALY